MNPVAPTTPVIDLGPVLPEIALVLAAIAILLVGAFRPAIARDALLAIAVAGIGVAAASTVWLWSRRGPVTVLEGAVAVDRFSVVARAVILVIALLALLVGRERAEGDGDDRPEFGALVLFATAGMTLLTAATDLIAVFLALEVLSLALYVLTGMSSRARAAEASMKYFLLGAFSSAFLLYGIAMAYGASGSTRLADVAAALSGGGDARALGVVAAALLLVGFAFKIGAVPFHMWVPDVYEGAPTPVTAFMSAATKVAAVAALARVLNVGLHPLAWDWGPMVAGVAAVTVVVGSVLAIAQSEVRRVLAYSSVAHAGFLLTGLVLPGAGGMEAALFYLVTYAGPILGAFAVLGMVARASEGRSDLEAFAGLSRRRPMLAALMGLFLLSMAGVPPTAGFLAKAGVFGAAVEAGATWLAVVGVVASVAAAAFYLRLLAAMYLREPRPGDPAIETSAVSLWTVAVPAAATLVLGVLPGVLGDLLERAAVIRW